MRRIDFLILFQSTLDSCKAMGIRVDDVRYIGLYNEYIHMMDRGEKVSYSVAVLAEKYGICERKVYQVIKHLQSECSGIKI